MSLDRFAIVAIGCRFPGSANTPEQFWKLLCDGTDAITEIPRERFDLADVYDPDPRRPGKIYTRWGGFVDDVDAFDAEFFGISPREAARIDPQQRLLLEVVWEALEDCGVPADRLAGSKTGVFIGISTHDYADLQVSPAQRHLIDSHCSTGTALSIAANRISYVYDLRGPSMVVDTACSSSLTAIHLACLSLKHRQCDLAIAGGVNVFLTPETAIGFCKASMLSPDGRCKAFDMSANGFVRGEGAGVVLLKPLEKAVADGGRIYAVVRGSAINQDGRTVGITVPSRDAQEALIREALRDADATPDAVQYVEAHGTGTRVGDPIEASAIGRVLSNGRHRSSPCLIGSVKTNIGHLEAAAGIAGLVKTALALQHRTIPPSLHFTEANPAIPLDDLGLRVVTHLQPWPGNGTVALASINSFGFGGANAHVVLEEPPQTDASESPVQTSAHILPLSARHPEALRQLASRYRDAISSAGGPSLSDMCYSAAVRRSHHSHRTALVGDTREQLLEQIEGFLSRSGADAVESGRGSRGKEPKLAFVFTGMGPQWWAMGRQLLEQEPVFRQAVEDCDRRFRDIGTWPLLESLTAHETVSRVHEPDLATTTNLAIQMGLVALLRSWGIVPDAIVGHSAGEMGAACAAGALSLEDALRVAFHRGRLQQRAIGSGTLLSAAVSEAVATQLIGALAGRVSIAAVNSPSSVTLSGDRRALDEISAELTQRQHFNRFVQVDVAYHGPSMDALREELIESLAPLAPRQPSVPLISTVSGTWIEAPLDAQYWFANLRRPVRFADAIDRLIDDDYDLFLEVGPHPALSPSVVECLSARGKAGTVLPTIRRKEEERRVMLRSLATLYARGRRVDWSGVYPRGTLVSLPRYPWQRERHWFEPDHAAPGPSGTDSGHPLLGHRLRSVRPSWETGLGQPDLDYLDDHIVQGSPVFPAAAYVEMALAASDVEPDVALVVEDFTFKRVLFLTHRKELLLQCLHDAQTSSFEIHSGNGRDSAGWTLHAAGKLRKRPLEAMRRSLDLAAIRGRCGTEVSVSDAYDALEARGLRYQGVFRGIQSLWRGTGEALACIGLPDDPSGVGPYRVHPALLDSAFQALLAAVETANAIDPQERGLYLPVSIKRVTLTREPTAQVWSHVRLVHVDAHSLEGDITIVDDAGQVVLAVDGLRCKALEEGSRVRRSAADEPTYQLVWEPAALGAPAVQAVSPVRASVEVAARLQPFADRLADRQTWGERLRQREPVFNAIVAHFTRAALIARGWQPGEAPPVDPRPLGDRLGVITRQHRFFARLLEILRDAPALNASDGTVDGEKGLAARLCEQMLSEYPENRVAVDLLRRCGERLDAILTGEVDAREVLFAPAAFQAWARFFVDLPWYEYYNTLVAEAIATAIEEIPAGAPVRVLEIGAGTAGTTLSVLSRLEGRAVDYLFTDLSPFFLAQARDRFRIDPRVRVAPLDIETDPVAQLGDERFDVIVAANVLHATADLRTSLGHIKKLLAPGGLLVLLEVARKMALTDLIFGITEGWWRFTDTDVRPTYPLLNSVRWEALLNEAGFQEPIGVSEPHGDQEAIQSVILATIPSSSAHLSRTMTTRDWLVFADSTGVSERIASGLRSRGDRCVTVRHAGAFTCHDAETYEIAAADPDQAAHLVNDLAAARFGFHGVIHAWSLDAPRADALTAAAAVDAQHVSCGSVAAVLQGFERSGHTLPPLWLVTAGAHAVGEASAAPEVAQAPIWGLGRVIASELADARCKMIDLASQPNEEEIRTFLDELDAGDLEEEVALRGGERYVTRLRRTRLRGTVQACQKQERSPERHTFRLDIDNPGAFETLTLRETSGVTPGPGEILIRVLAAGINFRDVMLSLGLLPPMAIPGSRGRTVLGFECAGVIVECGDGVTEFRPGDEVMAIAIGAFGSQVVTRAEMAAPKPGHLSFEQAATIPLAFVTAHYGLTRLAALSAGERVLIHAATGGVGLAAVQLAKRAGAEIYATAGNREKRAYLKAMGIAHVMDSRSVAFADEVLAATGGEGVDVVLNSLAGEAIPKGLSILRPYGRFVEMGKRDIHADAPIGLLPFDRNLSFCSIALERMCLDRPAFVGSLLREVATLVADHALEPIPHTAFDLADAEDALRFLAQAKHIGKIVLTVRRPTYHVAPCAERALCHPHGTYVISGGLGGFGLTVAQWMVGRGARHIVLMSRSGTPVAENQAALDALQASPAEIVLFKGDVSEVTDVRRMLELIRTTMPPVRGIVHGAMVLDDALLQHLTAERLQAVLAPKIGGAWNLHCETMNDSLDFFVMFSSTASLFGPKGQANYAAANLFLDTLAPYRRALGLPALTLNWGSLSDVGYVARHQEIAHHLQRHGMDSFTPTEAVGWLEEALRQGVPQLMVARFDWQRWSAVDPRVTVVRKSRRLAHLAPAASAGAHDAAAEIGDLRPVLAAASPEDRPGLLESHIVQRVARVLGTSPKKVDPERSLTDMGIDSLMAVELQTILERDFDASLPLVSFLEGATVRQLTVTVLDRLNLQVPDSAAHQPGSPAERRDGQTEHETVTSVVVAPVASNRVPETAPTSSGAPQEGAPRGAALVVPFRSARAEDVPTGTASAPIPGRFDYGSIDHTRWSPLQRLSQALIRTMFRLFAPVDVEGLENIPRSGPVLLAANHLSMLDVPLLLTILPRRCICIAADSLRKFPWLRWFLDIGDTIYVHRSEADQEALAQGLAVLKAGGLLGVAPEGTRSRTGGLMRGRSGVAYMAAEAGVPILPIAAYGQEHVVDGFRRLRRTRVHVRVGSLITLAPGEKTAAKLQRDTERVMTAIATMLPAGYRGVYANAVEQSQPSTADALSAG